MNNAHGAVVAYEIIEEANGPCPIVDAKLSGGHVYKGPISMDGSGYYKWNDGTSYEGDFQNGQMTGFGVYKLNNCTYNGHVYCGIRHGYGTLIIHDTNTKYVGEFANGKRHGKGIVYYNSDDVYDGEWRNGKREGKGTCVYKNGDEYTGDWLNDCKHGDGWMRWKSLNEIYYGQWKDNKPHGKGIHVKPHDTITIQQLQGLHNFTCFNGLNWYYGQWKDGKRDGFGIYNYANGSQYKGQWMHNKKHGEAEYIYENGAKYVGEFAHDQQKELSETTLKQMGDHFVIELKDDDALDMDFMYKIMLRHWKSIQRIFANASALNQLWMLIDSLKLKESQSMYDINEAIASYTVYPDETCNITDPKHRFLFREFIEILFKLSMYYEQDFESFLLNVIQLSPGIATISLNERFWNQLGSPYEELWLSEECRALFEQRYEMVINELSVKEDINESVYAVCVNGDALRRILQRTIAETMIQSIVMKQFETCYCAKRSEQPLIVQTYDIEMQLDCMRFLPHECRLFLVLLISIKAAFDQIVIEKERTERERERQQMEMEAQANQKGKKSNKDKKKKVEEERQENAYDEEENEELQPQQLKLVTVLQSHVDSVFDQIQSK
eukprot:75552_1